MDFVSALLRFAHIAGAIVWVGFGLYTYLILSRVGENMPAAAINYQLGVAKHSKFGQIMGMAALTTTIAGLALWGVDRPFATQTNLALIILSIGSLAGLAAMGHGFGVGKRTDALAKALLAAEENGAVAPSKFAEIGAMIGKLSRSANVSLGLMGVALLCMSTYSSF